MNAGAARTLLRRAGRWLVNLARLNERFQRLDAAAAHVQAQQAALHRRVDVLESRAGAAERLEAELESLRPLRSLVLDEPLPFACRGEPPRWLQTAEARLGQPLAELDEPARREAFYSYFSEMGGDSRPILHQQYTAYWPLLSRAAARGGRVLDIGCGAGELLAFLTEREVPALGVDMDPAEVVRARDAGHTVVEAEAGEFLATGEEAFAAITMLQVIEHVEPARVTPMLQACIRRLRPGGLLLVETVNLRHPLAFNGFFTDPTHRVPLPDNYLGFLFQWLGLEQVELLYTLPDPVAGLSRAEPARLYQNYTLLGWRGPAAPGSEAP